jgi:putative membrane protein
MTWIAFSPSLTSLHTDSLAGAAAAGAPFRVVPPFSWSAWPLHDGAIALLLVLFLAYSWAMRDRGRLPAQARRGEAWRWTAFFASQVLLFVSLNGPMHRLSDHYLFSAHMVQHLLLTELWAPLLLLALPPEVMSGLLDTRRFGPALRVLTRPVTAFVIFNVSFALWHLPALYDLMMRSRVVHELTHWHFMASALLMWWPICEAIPDRTRLSPPAKLIYLAAMNVPMMPVAGFISLAAELIYPWYQVAPRIFDLTPFADQQLGGLIMWLPGSVPYWLAMTIVYFRWALAQEAREQQSLHPAAAGVER